MCRSDCKFAFVCRWGCWAALVLATCLFQGAMAQDSPEYRKLRMRMVEEAIVREGVKNGRVLAAMRKVPRHLFVGQSRRQMAYFDQALPIGFQQTISPPFIVAYMTEIIDPQPTDRVLEIGTGSGYQAAVLSEIVQEVFTIEIVEQLGKSAARRLKRHGYVNVIAKVGDGYQGWPEHAPFDKIIVTCSPENVPQPLVDQLREGGKMIVPLGERYQQVFHLFQKRDGKLVQTRLIPTLFVPMTGVAEAGRKVKPDPTKPSVINGGFELDENQDGRADSWHYQRQAQRITSGAPEGTAHIKFTNQSPGRGAHALQGVALDGRHVRSLNVRLRVKLKNGRRGIKVFQRPALIIHYYDSDRRPIGEAVIGPWQGSFNWKLIDEKVKIPLQTREIVVRIGLNGATGLLSADDIRISRQ